MRLGLARPPPAPGRPASAADAAMSSPLSGPSCRIRRGPARTRSGLARTAARLPRRASSPSWQPDAVALGDLVLNHWATPRRPCGFRWSTASARRCASQEGNAAAACRIGLADDSRVTVLAEHLLEWQWPDGGWNCDPRPDATHSSFHETLPALWGLHEYRAATSDPTRATAVGAAGELLLQHHVVHLDEQGSRSTPPSSSRTTRPIGTTTCSSTSSCAAPASATTPARLRRDRSSGTSPERRRSASRTPLVAATGRCRQRRRGR